MIRNLINWYHGVMESTKGCNCLSNLFSLGSHNDNWGFFIPRNKALTYIDSKELKESWISIGNCINLGFFYACKITCFVIYYISM